MLRSLSDGLARAAVSAASVVAVVLVGVTLPAQPAHGDCETLPGSWTCGFEDPTPPAPPAPPPGGGGGGGGDGGGGDGGGGGGGTGTPGPEVEPPKPPCWRVDPGAKWGWSAVSPCTTRDYGNWSNEWGCYVIAADPQPPKDLPMWEGHKDGAIYYCTVFKGKWPHSLPRWSKDAPATVDVEEAITQQIRPKRVRIGIAPGYMRDTTSGTELVGIVGAPVWLWIPKSNSERQYGTFTETKVGRNGQVLRFTATATHVNWLMDDDLQVDVHNCGRGTPYHPRFGMTESPTCSYRYTKPGYYNVKAFVYWHITWDGWGSKGETTLPTASSVNVKIGEAQAPLVPEESE